MTEKETTQAEDLYNKYKGKVVEMYVGEKIGTQYYAEEDAEKRAYITGTIEGFTGNFLEVHCDMVTMNRVIHVPIDIFAWDIKGIMVKRDDGIHISAIFGEAKK